MAQQFIGLQCVCSSVDMTSFVLFAVLTVVNSASVNILVYLFRVHSATLFVYMPGNKTAGPLGVCIFRFSAYRGRVSFMVKCPPSSVLGTLSLTGQPFWCVHATFCYGFNLCFPDPQ